MTTRVKICGITNERDALAAVELGAHAVGFIFAESPRRVTPAQARPIIERLPPFVSKVGVFVDEEGAAVEETAAFCGLDTVQFHGSETPDYCAGFRAKVIKSFRVKDAVRERDLEPYRVDAFLLDTYSREAFGGTGKTFDWQVALEVKQAGRPLILSGGLNPENVAEAVELVCPYAVDVSSGVERAPGEKDPTKLKAFIDSVLRQ
ncbi:MAG: phosphoribosylanthranilate isomerase [Terriglobia bacterium]